MTRTPAGRDQAGRDPYEGFTNLHSVLRAYGEGNIFGESYGAGPAKVLWLHGWGRTSADFEAAAGVLANEGIASVSLDLPGFGASPLPERAGGSEYYAHLLDPVLDQLGVEPIVLVGHSNGGRVATALTLARPERVRALVLSGAPLVRATSPRPSPWPYRLVRSLHRRGVISETRMEAARQKYGSRDYRNATGLLRDILVASVNEDFTDRLGRIVAPVALVWGGRDADVTPEVARRIAAMLVNSSHVELDVLEGAGHLVPSERPAELAAHVRALVALS